MPGGDTKMETSSNTHHTNEIMRNSTVKYRRMRTDQRL
jgi:hypothetical protein